MVQDYAISSLLDDGLGPELEGSRFAGRPPIILTPIVKDLLTHEIGVDYR
jgi:hypothetical protein